MVPFGDAFNHAHLGVNHCLLEADSVDGAFLMRCMRPVRKGQELFNCYGALNSGRLLSSFGFVSHSFGEQMSERGSEVRPTPSISVAFAWPSGLRAACRRSGGTWSRLVPTHAAGNTL